MRRLLILLLLGLVIVGATRPVPSFDLNSMYWGAGAMEVDGTNCSSPTAVALVTSGPTPLTIACADNDASTITGSTMMPPYWNGGTVTFTLEVGTIAATGGVFAMDFEAQCIGSGEAHLAWSNTGQQRATITMAATDDLSYTATTAAVTLNGTTCAAGDSLHWQGDVDATASAANLETIGVVKGVRMDFN